MIKLRTIEWMIYMLLVNVAIGLFFEICFLPSYTAAAKVTPQDEDENEFAEFEDLDDDLGEFVQNEKHPPTQQPASAPPTKPPSVQSDSKSDDADGMVEEEDDDEFEMVREESEEIQEKPINENVKSEDLKITKIPLHLRANWESYYLEFIMIFSLVVYFINFFSGRNRNYNIAQTWLEKNAELLEYNFALVGDDGKVEVENPGLLKETENVYTLWCSGRASIEGMLTEIHLLKRQDLFSLIVNYFKPTNDKIVIKIQLSPDVLDNFIFCIANRKCALRLSKEMNDIATYCPERKSPEKYSLNGDVYQLLNEFGEAASFILDNKVISLLNKNEDLVEMIHISDQYSGLRNSDESAAKFPEVKKMLIASFNLPVNTSRDLEQLERMKPLLQMVFYLVDKIKRFRLSRESKTKSDRNRQKVEKQFLQSTHYQRQELAQMKREERRRQEKERMIQEMDPEKQRKWEEKEYKRELKRKTPKMKQLKVKAM